MCFTREVGLFYAQEMCKTGSLARCYVTQSILQWIIVLYIMDHIYYFVRRKQILDISTIHLYKQMCNYNKGNKGAGQHEGNYDKPDQRYKEQLYRKIVI